MPDLHETALLEILACPQCGGNLKAAPDQAGARCEGCQRSYSQENGIWKLLSSTQLQHYQPFINIYRPLRQREGWERPDSSYYLDLPHVPRDDPQAGIWRIRRRSLKVLQQQASVGLGRWAADLGAGNGWLSHQLTQWGWQVAALDLNMVGPDSLEGAQLYQQHSHNWFGLVQASMEHLPFHDGVLALVVASGTLHYAALELTLPDIWRVLQPGGRFVLTDSPLYQQVTAGRAMVQEYKDMVSRAFGYEPQWVGGSGFLVEPELLDGLRQQGFDLEIFSIERNLGKLKRLALQPLKTLLRQREQAHFSVIVAHKPLAAIPI